MAPRSSCQQQVCLRHSIEAHRFDRPKILFTANDAGVHALADPKLQTTASLPTSSVQGTGFPFVVKLTLRDLYQPSLSRTLWSQLFVGLHEASVTHNNLIGCLCHGHDNACARNKFYLGPGLQTFQNAFCTCPKPTTQFHPICKGSLCSKN
jgi:hypothetical protein